MHTCRISEISSIVIVCSTLHGELTVENVYLQRSIRTPTFLGEPRCLTWRAASLALRRIFFPVFDRNVCASLLAFAFVPSVCAFVFVANSDPVSTACLLQVLVSTCVAFKSVASNASREFTSAAIRGG